MTPDLDIKHVDVTYGHVVAVKDVSTVVNRGEVVAMIGGNGAGKSSIVRAVMGMTPYSSGEIYGVGGINMKSIPPHRVCGTGIALVPSERQVFASMTVRENLEMGAYTISERASAEREIEVILERFPVLAQRANHLAGILSGGQQQLLAIGRALAAQPKLLLMDEPSLGLAPVLVEEVFELVQELNREGMSILLIEQNAKRALEISHRAYVLRAGELIAEGPSDDLLNDPVVAEAYLGRLVTSN